MTRAITATLAVASSMVQLRRPPKTAREWAEPFRVGLLLKGNFGLMVHGRSPFLASRAGLGGDHQNERGHAPRALKQ